MTFLALPCSVLSLDAMDVSGEHELDVIHDVYKRKVGLDGLPFGDVLSQKVWACACVCVCVRACVCVCVLNIAHSHLRLDSNQNGTRVKDHMREPPVSLALCVAARAANPT